MSGKELGLTSQEDESGSISEKVQLQQQALNDEDINNYLYLEKPWYKYSFFWLLHFYVFLITLTSTNLGYDGSMLNGLQSLEDWNKSMGYPTGSILGALSNGNTFGVLLCFPFASYVSDRFGRKRVIMVGASLNVIGAVLQGASYNYAFFLISRIILGFGFGISTVSAPSLIAEISYPRYRDTCTAIYNSFYYLGAIMAAWITYGTRNISNGYSWKIPSYLQGFLPLVQLLLFFLVPESPRYLLSKGKVDRARKILHKFHTGADEDERAHILIEFEIKQIQSALEMEKLYSSSRYADFFKIPSFRKRLFLTSFTAFLMQLSGNGLVSYYLNKVLDSIGITGTKRQLEINGCLNVYNIVISWAAASVCYRFKRRFMFLTSISGMLVTYIIWTVLSAINQKRNFEQTSLANGVLAMIFLYYLCYDFGLNGLPYLYVTEILPYSHRAKGLNIFQFCQQAFVVYNGFVNPVAMENIEWKYYIVYCCILAVELVLVYFFYVETFGHTLEEVATVFGDDTTAALQAFQQASNEKIATAHVESNSEHSDNSSKQVLQV
ncbi:general substrate transporter [Scheffersomyces amazonensis]|uniref:general substrate transporter n=1 Tax=Scheffersomyces amazonensis TaxID=1078765 RepID=UPI00315C8A65